MQYGVIMAGGAGTRLWPLSSRETPKQLLPVVKGKSLLQLSYERLRGILPAERIYVCTGEHFRQKVLANLPELPSDNLLGEPEGRDTANAVGFPAAVLKKRDPDAVFAIVTADHVIEPIEVFQQALQTSFAVVEKDPLALVTFGITPTYAHTGLGYIQRGEAIAGFESVYQVQAFKEKPDKPTADRYVESGRYYWNSGMFVWRADTVLIELGTHLPESFKGLSQIADAWGTPDQDKTLKEAYPKLPKISIDYGVLEPASQRKGKAHVVAVEMPVQWLDVGSWPALAESESRVAEPLRAEKSAISACHPLGVTSAEGLRERETSRSTAFPSCERENDETVNGACGRTENPPPAARTTNAPLASPPVSANFPRNG